MIHLVEIEYPDGRKAVVQQLHHDIEKDEVRYCARCPRVDGSCEKQGRFWPFNMPIGAGKKAIAMYLDSALGRQLLWPGWKPERFGTPAT